MGSHIFLGIQNSAFVFVKGEDGDPGWGGEKGAKGVRGKRVRTRGSSVIITGMEGGSLSPLSQYTLHTLPHPFSFTIRVEMQLPVTINGNNRACRLELQLCATNCSRRSEGNSALVALGKIWKDIAKDNAFDQVWVVWAGIPKLLRD